LATLWLSYICPRCKTTIRKAISQVGAMI
jgi:hypothetical protein